MGITKEEREVIVKFEDSKIIIEKRVIILKSKLTINKTII